MYDKEKQIIMSILKLILTAVFAVSTIIPAFAQTEPERKDNEVVWAETDGVTIPLPPNKRPGWRKSTNTILLVRPSRKSARQCWKAFTKPTIQATLTAHSFAPLTRNVA